MIQFLILLVLQHLGCWASYVQITYDYNLTFNSSISYYRLSKNGSFLYVGYDKGVVEVYSNQSGYKTLVNSIDVNLECSINNITPLNHDNKLLLIVNKTYIQIWKFIPHEKTYKLLEKITQPDYHPLNANIAKNQQTVIVTGFQGIIIWNSSEPSVKRKKFGTNFTSTSIQFSNDNKTVLIGGTENPFLNTFLRSLFIFNLDGKYHLNKSEILEDMPILQFGAVMRNFYSINQKKIVVLTTDSSSVIILDAETLKKSGKLVHDDKVLDVIYHKNGKHIISLCQNKQIYIWGAESYLLLQRVKLTCLPISFKYINVEDKLFIKCQQSVLIYNLKIVKSNTHKQKNNSTNNTEDEQEYTFLELSQSYTLEAFVIGIYILCLFSAILGFKHNSLIFYLQTLSFLGLKLGNIHVYQFRFSHFQNGYDLSKYIFDVPDEKDYIFGTMNSHGNIFKNASQVLIGFIIIKLISLLLRGLFYRFPNFMQRFTSYKKQGYRFMEFLLKSMIYPLIFFSQMTIKNYINSNSQYAIYSLFTSILLLIFISGFSLLKIFAENIKLYNKYQWAIQILFDFMVSISIVITPQGTAPILIIIILLLLRQIVQLYGRYRLNENNFQAMNYLRIFCLFAEVLSIYALSKSNSFFQNVLMTLAIIINILYILVRLNKNKVIVEKSINLEESNNSNNNNNGEVPTDSVQREVLSQSQLSDNNNKQVTK